MPDAFRIVQTMAELKTFAGEHDGACKITLTQHGAMAIDPDRELGGSVKWEYYMSDEPMCFDPEKWGLTP